MRQIGLLLLVGLAFLGGVSTAGAAEISGEYLEARTCDVYTGPCFANGEVGIAGKEAVMAWKVDEGKWDGQDLSGLGVALVVKANDTLGFGGKYVNSRPDKVVAVIVVDERATPSQRVALVKFVTDSAPHLTKDVVKVESAEVTLTNDHLSGKGIFSAGKLAKIETRALVKGDCVCSNEIVFYPPLNKVDNAHPAYTLNMTFEGQGLDQTWSTINKRSAFMGTFER